MTVLQNVILILFLRDFSRNQRNRAIWNKMGQIATRGADKHLYAFITSEKIRTGIAGWANIGTLCGPRTKRVSISKYMKGRTAFTARVNINFVVI